ncbi:CopG family transcriptional regulator [Streptomyces lydicus]|uniref:CopG family transcriptional regulator n=1 Tax=Streptomyces lydicus TaxID=47763 RepID=UPI00378CD14F
MSWETSYSSVDRKVGRLETDLNYSLSSVRSTLSDVEQAVEELEGIPRRVDSLEQDLREAKEETEQVESNLDDRISTVDGDVERVVKRVEALERHLRQADGAVVVDLDEDRGGELRSLTATVEKGLAARAGLLSDHERYRLQYCGKQLKDALEERGRHRAAVLQAAKVLATTQAGDDRRKAAEIDFAASAPKAQKIHSQVGALTTTAEGAKAKLEADDALHAKRAKTIDAGERADTKLRMRLRSRLSSAISSANLLPLWFVTVLGPLPPKRSANEWMGTATDLLAYRITYGVADPVVALGDKPDGHRQPRRMAWHRQLSSDLRRW